jgi:hypothetical protein
MPDSTDVASPLSEVGTGISDWIFFLKASFEVFEASFEVFEIVVRLKFRSFWFSSG